MQDFLGMPGGSTQRPSTRPSVGGDRTQIGGDRTNIGGGDRTNIGGDRTNIGNRTDIRGDTNININRQNNVNSIRNKWTSVDRRPFDRGYWGGYVGRPGWRWQGAWGRYPAGWCWRPCTWAAFGGWFAWNWAQPRRYDYGTTIVYRDNYVYYGDQQVGTTEVYYEQAETIAESVPPQVNAEQVEWMPLGVFAIAEESATDSGMLLQLAVSKEGIIAGTFYNETTDEGKPVEGMVDQESQRAVWKLTDGSNPDVVMESGVFNLTQDETTALVHFGPDQTQTWLMVRLENPEGGS